MTFDIVILKLPQSEKLVKIMECASGSSYGARYWTDGKVARPRLQENPDLIKTPEGVLVWANGCKVIAVIGHFDSGRKQWDHVQWATPATESDLMYALTWNLAKTADQEKGLRINLWHAGNDHIRNGGKEKLPQFHLENIRSLLPFLTETDAASRLMRAEALRELGLFDKALDLLAGNFEEGFQNAISRMKELTMSGSTQVAELFPS